MAEQLTLYGVDGVEDITVSHGYLVCEQPLVLLLRATSDPYPAAYEDDDRIAFEALTVCCVCGRPVEPRTQAEYDACESLGVHLGDCWHALKQDLARLPGPRFA